MQSQVPEIRVRLANTKPVADGGSWIVYWMTTARRTRFNFALQRAAEWSRHLHRPLIVLEALRSSYPWASHRLHRFVIDGMAANREALAARPVTYLPYIEPGPDAGRGLLEALAVPAAVVVTDEYPTFFIPKMVRAAAARLPVRLEVVDGNGLLPLAASNAEFATAYSFRRFLQKNLVEHITSVPLEDPLAADLPPPIAPPESITERWPPPAPELLAADPVALASLPIDNRVPPVELEGGEAAGRRVLENFVAQRLDDYPDRRNRPEDDATSGLSPYLHFGHVSAHEVWLRIATRARWSVEDIIPPANGRRAGWWGANAATEAFLDQLITWRELGFHFCHHRPDHAEWSSLPEWAQRTLDAHAQDPREHLYTLDDLSRAATHDLLWNAAQTQLLREGRIHNYLRMLWGKKVLEWTRDPREALEFMIELNDRWALDGRDPNSVTGIGWVLGRHDRPWGPERPIFGTVRYMSSANTARKFPVRAYIERYGQPEEG